MFFVHLKMPLGVAPDEILGRIVVDPYEPLREFAPSPTVRLAAPVLTMGDVHLHTNLPASLDALLVNTDAGPDIAACLARYGRLYLVAAARTADGKIVQLAYHEITPSPDGQKDYDPGTNVSRAFKWLLDHRVPERALGSAMTVAASPITGSVIAMLAGGIASDYIAPSVKSGLANLAAGMVDQMS
ncbi:hypothetical protein AURDEDRAFT_154696 [Auricularia subglabra TFB-10046 SS5]|nr:hypothetical protein AURDEDRAFT_154696 [Auricularia subglabra TFB-10046 SS5]